MVAGEHARPGFAERHGGIVAALRLAEDEPEQPGQQQERQDITGKRHDAHPGIGRLNLDLDVIGGKLLGCHPQAGQLVDQGRFDFLLHHLLDFLVAAVNDRHLVIVANNQARDLAILDIGCQLVQGQILA